MQQSIKQPIRLSDYQAPAFVIDSVDLHFELYDTHTVVRSELKLRVHADTLPATLALDGDDLDLVEIALDDVVLNADRYVQTATQLILKNPPPAFKLTVTTRLNPKQNTQLSGLYQSNSIFCTQCEAHGFRRITFYLDRPDVLARFTTTICADKTAYPVLLSNGNLSRQGTTVDGRHWVTWVDPFKKPCYLFALVAGNLAKFSDTYTTLTQKQVALNIYVEQHNVDKCAHAMLSLKKAMRWDEEKFAREYDLETFNIVAVADFNMGAMENKGLNIFNAQYILANPETATDTDYQNIESVVAHEYFHNWTGNRVTCRDWFQLSLKEGLTVYRDQEFSRDMNSRAVNRIQDVQSLRTRQFAEDSGPTAHPVCPKEYLEVDNFYTATIYDKGAEVVRMLETLLGVTGFRKGMDKYFLLYDGCAVTIDDFIMAMETANNYDLKQFRLWYAQAGTPEVKLSIQYAQDQQSLTINTEQWCKPSPGQAKKLPYHIPLRIALIDTAGHVSREQVLSITQAKQTFVLPEVSSKPLLSVLRDFSAPVRVHIAYTDAELIFLLEHDDNGFARWEAGQRLATRYLFRLIDAAQRNEQLTLPDALCDAYRAILLDATLDVRLRAELLSVPSEAYLASEVETIDVDAIHTARRHYFQQLATVLQPELESVYRTQQSVLETGDTEDAMGFRQLKNTCLQYLSYLNDAQHRQWMSEQFNKAKNMTDSLAALALLSHQDCPQRPLALQDFYRRWVDDDLVLDKWFSVQACSQLPKTLGAVQQLMQHEKFSLKNPNKVRALIGTFANQNAINFHAKDGSGYVFLTEQIKNLDRINPQIAARLLTPLTRWRKYDVTRKAHMQAQLRELMSIKTLSADVYEIVAKSLG